MNRDWAKRDENERAVAEPAPMPPTKSASSVCMFCDGARVSGYRVITGVNGESYQVAIRCQCSPLTEAHDHKQRRGKRK